MNLGLRSFYLSSIAFIICSSLGARTFAGIKEGGGGGVYVCPSTGTPDVELVDLFEAEANGLKIKYDNVTPLALQLSAATTRLGQISPTFANQVIRLLATVQLHQRGGPNVFIPKPTDINETYGKKGCSLQGMMYFDDLRDNLVRDTTLFNAQKTITDFAASYMHEAIYKAMRDNSLPGAGSSTVARLIVGCLFADIDAGKCLGFTNMPQPDDAWFGGASVWSCDLSYDHEDDTGKTLISIYAYFNSYDPNYPAWNVIATKLNGTPMRSISMASYFLSDMAAYPQPVNKRKLGRFLTDGDFREVAIPPNKDLEFLLTSMKGYDFTVVSANPLTIQTDKSTKKYVCKLVSKK